MTIAYYLSHPQVEIDPMVPVPSWGLSWVGRNRVESVRTRPWLSRIGRIVSSGETKAIETAQLIAEVTGAAVEVHEDMHENDRSTTGFLPPNEFEAVADAFFAQPDQSVRGWETALSGQARIVAAVRRVIGSQGDNPILFVGHGGVGTLLACAIGNMPIDRRYDQGRCGANPGGGNVHAFASDCSATHFHWRPMEDL